MADNDLISLTVQRAVADPLFLGYDLREYCQFSELNELDLSKLLECSIDDVKRLALCLRPSPNTPQFRADVERIALHCGADTQKLVSILRELDSVRTMRNVSGTVLHAHPDRQPLLLAARDRPDIGKRGGQKNRRKSAR